MGVRRAVLQFGMAGPERRDVTRFRKPRAPSVVELGIRGSEMDTFQFFEQTRQQAAKAVRGSLQVTSGKKANGFWDDTARELRRARWSCPCCRVAIGVPEGAFMLGPQRSSSRVLV